MRRSRVWCRSFGRGRNGRWCFFRWESFFTGQADILRLRSPCVVRVEAEGVGAVRVDDVDRIDAIAFGFAHPFAFAVEDCRIDRDMMKWNFLPPPPPSKAGEELASCACAPRPSPPSFRPHSLPASPPPPPTGAGELPPPPPPRPCCSMPGIITIRATQSVMMSRPVIRTLVGYHLARSAVCSGQPRVLWGQRALLNQVSRTSGSWMQVVRFEDSASKLRGPSGHSRQADVEEGDGWASAASSRVIAIHIREELVGDGFPWLRVHSLSLRHDGARARWIVERAARAAGAAAQTGLRWPHQSWRETGQSRFSPSQERYCCAWRSGRRTIKDGAVAHAASGRAGSARGAIFTNHWSLRYGSMAVLLRSLWPTWVSYGSSFPSRPCGRQILNHFFPGRVAAFMPA